MSPAEGDDDVVRILFIGNSYTYYNDLPEILEGLAASLGGRSVETRSMTPGGATLERHWDEGRARKAIAEGGWDWVVLQPQSTFGTGTVVSGLARIGSPEKFFRFARLFDAEIRQVGARTALYQFWPRRKAPNIDRQRLATAFLDLGEELGATVIPAGPAWLEALAEQPDLPLYDADGSHPAPAGSYLAACAAYAALLERSPRGAAARVERPVGRPLVDLEPEVALLLQGVAWSTYRESRAAATTSKASASP